MQAKFKRRVDSHKQKFDRLYASQVLFVSKEVGSGTFGTVYTSQQYPGYVYKIEELKDKQGEDLTDVQTLEDAREDFDRFIKGASIAIALGDIGVGPLHVPKQCFITRKLTLIFVVSSSRGVQTIDKVCGVTMMRKFALNLASYLRYKSEKELAKVLPVIDKQLFDLFGKLARTNMACTDLKPANVLVDVVDGYPVIKLTDFDANLCRESPLSDPKGLQYFLCILFSINTFLSSKFKFRHRMYGELFITPPSFMIDKVIEAFDYFYEEEQRSLKTLFKKDFFYALTHYAQNSEPVNSEFDYIRNFETLDDLLLVFRVVYASYAAGKTSNNDKDTARIVNRILQSWHNYETL